MKRIPRPSPAMIVAMIALIVAIGGTAVALPGKYTVGKKDLKTSSVGARALGRMLIEHSRILASKDPVANDGVFTETKGEVLCPRRAPTALDPWVGVLGPKAFEGLRVATTNRFGAPAGYHFVVSSDEGPDVGYTMKVNCLPAR